MNANAKRKRIDNVCVYYIYLTPYLYINYMHFTYQAFFFPLFSPRPGIEVGQATQTNNSQLEVSWWEEPVPSCAQTPCKYTITLSNNGMVTIYTRSCLGRKGDCTQLLDVAGASEIEVKVEREMFSSSARPRVYAFKGEWLREGPRREVVFWLLIIIIIFIF